MPEIIEMQTLDALRISGWTAERLIDISRYEKFLKAAGYSPGDAVVAFLRAFGGLNITRRTALGNDLIEIDPCDAASGVTRARIRTYEDFLGTSLCPIGTYFTRSFTIMMSPEGKVYAGADETLRHLGDSGSDALDNLITKHQSKLLRGI